MYFISRLLLKLFLNIFFRVEYHGRENYPEPPFIIAGNHTSNLDPPLVGVSCNRYPVDFMAKSEMYKTPVLGLWAKAVGTIEVRRGDASIKSLKDVLARLKAGRVVGIFPEGTRSVDGDIGAAKRGIGFLIERSRVPVVPVFIEGSSRALPRGGKMKPGTSLKVHIGRPLYPGDMERKKPDGKPDYRMIADIVMEKILELKPRV